MEALHALIRAFNRGSLDVPADLFTPRTTFSLNERSYESILGASPDDPLIRLLARGAAGYRTAAKALQYALQTPTVTIESLSEDGASGVREARVRVDGHLRGSDESFAGYASLRLTCVGQTVTAIEVACSEEDLARLATARRS